MYTHFECEHNEVTLYHDNGYDVYTEDDLRILYINHEGPEEELEVLQAAYHAAVDKNSELTAESMMDDVWVWTVVDQAGGRWWPDEQTAIEINRSDSPEETAVKICENEPMRGTWQN